MKLMRPRRRSFPPSCPKAGAAHFTAATVPISTLPKHLSADVGADIIRLIHADRVTLPAATSEDKTELHIQILSEVHKQIISCFKNAPIESGGILGIKNGVICSFAMDLLGERSCSEYHPDVKSLNKIISEWAECGISFYGIIHSHPNGQYHLSDSDKEYFDRIYRSVRNVNNICCPIVVYDKGDVRIHTYVYKRKWERAELSILQRL